MQIIKPASTHKVLYVEALLLMDCLYFLLSDPGSMPILLMAIGWLLVGLTIYVGCAYGAKLSLRLGLMRVQKKSNLILLSTSIYLLLALQAVGQLSFRDISAIIPLVIIGYLYFKRLKSDKVTA